jgi:hypothetical protein
MTTEQMTAYFEARLAFSDRPDLRIMTERSLLSEHTIVTVHGALMAPDFIGIHREAQPRTWYIRYWVGDWEARTPTVARTMATRARRQWGQRP